MVVHTLPPEAMGLKGREILGVGTVVKYGPLV